MNNIIKRGVKPNDEYVIWNATNQEWLVAFRHDGMQGEELRDAISRGEIELLIPFTKEEVVNNLIQMKWVPKFEERHPDFSEKSEKNGWTWTHIPSGRQKFFHRRTVDITETSVGNLQELGWRNRPTGQEVARDMERFPNTWK